MDSQVPLKMTAASMSPVSGGVIVDASFEHDSSCLFVFASGLMLQHVFAYGESADRVTKMMATVPAGLTVNDILVPRDRFNSQRLHQTYIRRALKKLLTFASHSARWQSLDCSDIRKELSKDLDHNQA